ncbi:hypothetical protein D3C78_1080640 [compost metagenome]
MWGYGAAGDAVGALHIVAQHVAGQGQLALGGCHRIAVRYRMRHIVDDVDIQRTTGHITIGVADQDADTLALCIGPSAVRMCLGVAQGVAVTDHTGRSIVTGDGQHVAQPGSDGLTHTGHRASRDDVDATDIQVEHTIRRHHSKTAGPGQGGGIACRTLDQVGFVEVQLASINLQTFDSDRVVDHR